VGLGDGPGWAPDRDAERVRRRKRWAVWASLIVIGLLCVVSLAAVFGFGVYERRCRHGPRADDFVESCAARP